jgi:hypothetical protein
MAKGGVRAAVILALAAAACSTPARKPPPATLSPPSSRATLTPPPAARPRPLFQPRASSSKDSCGAAELQYLVGKPRTDIPVPVYPNRRRVLCSSCEIAPGYVSWRQTIIYDARTGVVTSVKCG